MTSRSAMLEPDADDMATLNAAVEKMGSLDYGQRFIQKTYE